MAYDPYKEAQNININNLDKDGNDITKKQKEQEKQENQRKDSNDQIDNEVAGKLGFVKKLLYSELFDEAKKYLGEAEQAECNRVGSKGICDNPEVYWCKVLLNYEALDEDDLISKMPDLEHDKIFKLAVTCCKTEEQRQHYQSVVDKINEAKTAEREQETENLKKQVSERAAKHKAELTAEEEARQKKLKRIHRLIDAGEFDEAKERLDKIEQDEEDSTGDCEIPLVYHYKMLLDYKARDDEELIARLAERQEDITKNRNYRLAKSCAEDAEDDDEFNTLLDIKKKATEGVAKAKAEAERKHKEEEERKKREEEERKRKIIASLTQQADEAYNNKQYQNALNLYNQAVKLGANNLQSKIKQAEKDEEARKALNSLWDYKDLGNGYVNFGAYPQSKKAGNVKIGGIFDDGRGYYLGSDNCLYEKYEGCYYKLEPIKWKVLSRGGECFIVTDMLLDAHCFDNDSNNYANSDIRSWLNNDFYDKAFKDSQQSKIVTTNVDNSVSSTGYSSNQYVCGNTSDKVFLLSREEVQLYFYNWESRKKKGTDYAKARNLEVDGDGNSYWWLRSPYYSYSSFAQYIGYVCFEDGFKFDGFKYYIVYVDGMGVLPALKIKP